MIYCNLKGGLGNMLFQIAGTKSLAIDKNVDCSFPNLLGHLEYLNRDDYYNDTLKHSYEYLSVLQPLNTYSNPNLQCINYPFHFVEIQTPNDEFIVNGFFQSEKYFKHNREAILRMLDFSFYDKHVEEKYGFIQTKKCTSIHVRRGDYVNLPNHHPTQMIEYYLNSINILKDTTEHFLIFSDDITWCKANLKLENAIYIDDEKDYIELYLMSLCDNNIIANSSFSWWGAWLNKNTNKKVIAPKQWFGALINENDNDIIPEDWIKI